MSRDSAASPPALEVRRLGRVPYAAALDLQERVREARLERRGPDTLLLLEHPDVITFGRGARGGNVHLSEAELHAAGYDVFHVGRGGDVTWHGPGQLVGYPILDLGSRERDVHVYLRRLEGLLIDVLGEFGIPAGRRDRRAGVWLDERRKIASIGVGLRRWVTIHGFALNVCCDLSRFDAIVPCGLRGVEMTSMAEVLGRDVALEAVADRVEAAFGKAFG
jgi:lipoate-protein ligase B